MPNPQPKMSVTLERNLRMQSELGGKELTSDSLQILFNMHHGQELSLCRSHMQNTKWVAASGRNGADELFSLTK